MSLLYDGFSGLRKRFKRAKCEGNTREIIVLSILFFFSSFLSFGSQEGSLAV